MPGRETVVMQVAVADRCVEQLGELYRCVCAVRHDDAAACEDHRKLGPGQELGCVIQRLLSADAAFHEAVALSSGNRLLSYLFEAMSEPLRQSFFLSTRGHDTRGHTFDDTITAHQAIFDAIQAGSAKGAAAAMRHHLEETEQDIRIALGSSPRRLR